jgi:hypothetical protein
VRHVVGGLTTNGPLRTTNSAAKEVSLSDQTGQWPAAALACAVLIVACPRQGVSATAGAKHFSPLLE